VIDVARDIREEAAGERKAVRLTRSANQIEASDTGVSQT
jgi:hypothetical protein